MTPMLTLAILLYLFNAVVFGVLALIYGRTAVSTKARYPIGLFIFSILLLVQSAGTAATYLFFSSYLNKAVPSMLAMAAVELVGACALARTAI